MNVTFKYTATAAAKHAGLLRPFDQRNADSAIAEAWAPRCLCARPQLCAEYQADDNVFALAAIGFPKLVSVGTATSYLTHECGGALRGVQLSVRPDDGNINATVTYQLSDAQRPTGVPEDVVHRMVELCLAAVGLIGAFALFVNLADAGLTELEARRRSRRAFARYSPLLEGLPAWEGLTKRRMAGRDRQ